MLQKSKKMDIKMEINISYFKERVGTIDTFALIVGFMDLAWVQMQKDVPFAPVAQFLLQTFPMPPTTAIKN